MKVRTLEASEDLTSRFGYHPAVTTGDHEKQEHVRAACLSLALQLDELVPDGREKSLAFTNLEQTMFWGLAGIERS